MTGRLVHPPFHSVTQSAPLHRFKVIEKFAHKLRKVHIFVLCFLFCPNTFTRPRRRGPLSVPGQRSCSCSCSSVSGPVFQWAAPFCLFVNGNHPQYMCTYMYVNHVNASPSPLFSLSVRVCCVSLLRWLFSSLFLFGQRKRTLSAQFHTKNAIKCDAFHYPRDLYFQPVRRGKGCCESQWKWKKFKSIKLNCRAQCRF